jgi:hypothetical protein
MRLNPFVDRHGRSFARCAAACDRLPSALTSCIETGPKVPLGGDRSRETGSNEDGQTDAASTPIDDVFTALRAIVEGTAQITAEIFLAVLVPHLAEARGVNYAFGAEFAKVSTRVWTLTYWGKGAPLPNVEFELAGTPCEDVVRGGLWHLPAGVQADFPGDRD